MNTTFIIPIRVESSDRARNIRASVRYLLKNTDSLIMIKEVDGKANIPSILEDEMSSSRVSYSFEESADSFHRTRYLNDMLQACKTRIVCNYDADVILHPDSYSLAESVILENHAEVVYPYPESDAGQIRLFFTQESENKFLETAKYESLAGSATLVWRAHAGFCFFADRESYIRVGAENENFVSWGPEDGERISRFSKMGLRIARLRSPVIHMEHSRSPDSDDRNPHTKSNWELFEKLMSMDSRETSLYLDSQEYLLRRGWRS